MPSDYALVTLPEAKTFLGLSDISSSEDAILEALIDAVTFDFEDYWHTYGVRRQVTERHTHDEIRKASRSANTIWLDKFPVVPSGIAITDPAGNSIDSDDYWIDQDIAALRTTGGWSIPQDANGFASYWSITYTGGHWANTAAVPPNVKTACKMYIASLYKRPDREVQSKSVGDLSITYAKSLSEELPTAVERMICRYKKVEI